jgi:hypothetical protein
VNGICGKSSPLKPNLRSQGIACVAVVCAVFLGALALGNGAAAATGKPERPKPQNLWQSYPLDPARHGTTGPSGTQTPRPTHATPRGSASDAGDSSSGGISWRLLLIAVAVAGGVALLALELRHEREGPHGHGARLRRPRLPFRPKKGESIMGKKRLKWAREERGATSKPESVTASDIEAHGDGAVSEPTEAQLTTDPAEVGAEVEIVLKSAQEAAASIRLSAKEDATRIREEAKAAAEADRADARRVRGEADAYAQQVRADADRDAEQLREKARVRLEQVDQEIEQKLHDAEQDARERREELETQSERYHERLESMLGAFRGMSSEIADLLETPNREAGSTEAEPGRKTLEEALREYGATSGRS